MAGITLEQAEAQLAAWLAASEAVARNQSYRIGERQLTRADAAEVRRMVDYWDGKVQALAGAATGRGRVRQAVPL